MQRLDGKVALITGAGRGIGRAYAHALSAAGAQVVVNDLIAPTAIVDEIRAQGGTASAIAGDVSSFSASGQIVADALSEFGQIDILVANAGILRASSLHEQSEEDWSSTLAIHANGTFNMYRHVAPHMIARNTGTVITTGAAPLEGYFPGLAAYRAAKAAILVMTLTAANELRDYNININSIMPGSTYTPMQQSFFASMGKDAENWPKGSPPETIPPLGVFLCSEEGRQFSGFSFHIFGDTGIKVVTSYGTRAQMEADGNIWGDGELAGKLSPFLKQAANAQFGLEVS